MAYVDTLKRKTVIFNLLSLFVAINAYSAENLPFEAVFQGLCENNRLCEQLCFNLHDGTFECDCQKGYNLDSNGYSCTKQNISEEESSLLYEKDANFVAMLQDRTPHEDFEKNRHVRRGTKLNLYTSKFLDKMTRNEVDETYFEPIQKGTYNRYELLDKDSYTQTDDYYDDDQNNADENIQTTPGPNLEQKVPSEPPNLDATESLLPSCSLDCWPGKCITGSQPRCQCPLGRYGSRCNLTTSIEIGRFHGSSWAAFAPLKEAYRDVQLTLEFNPKVPNGVLLVSGENDDLSGDFMAAIIIDRFVEFRWDCGSGAGVVRSTDPIQMGGWNRITVYRDRWDVWVQVNNGRHVQGRSEGLFSRITFREPLYVGGAYNLTSLSGRLGVTAGFEGCIRKLQVNDHVYKFSTWKNGGRPSAYNAVDGWDIGECSGEPCSMQCQNGGKCLSSPVDNGPSSITESLYKASPSCICPLSYTGQFCEKQSNIEVPSFNGSSLLVFPPFGKSALSWLELELVFRSSSTEGVLLFGGQRSDGSSDFISLVLSEAHVLFLIDLGSGPLTLRSMYPVRPGVWHTIKISRTARRTWLYVDDQIAVEGLTPGAFTMLSLSQPLYLGGLPSSNLPPSSLAETQSFVGCIQKLTVGSQEVELISDAISGSNIGSCSHPCSDRPCENGGICKPHGQMYTCKCPSGYDDPHCTSKVITQVAIPSFNGRAFLQFSDEDILKRLTGSRLHLWFRFRSVASNGLLIWIGSENSVKKMVGDSFTVHLIYGKISITYNLGSGSTVLTYNSSNLCDGKWHMVKIQRVEKEVNMNVDGGSVQSTTSPGDLVQLNVDSPLYIGGKELYRSVIAGDNIPGLEGCIADFTIATDYHVDLITQATAGQNIDYC